MKDITFSTTEANSSDKMDIEVFLIGGSLSFIIILPMLIWMCYKCYKVHNRDPSTREEGYSVAVSNHLFKDENALMEDLPCQGPYSIEKVLASDTPSPRKSSNFGSKDMSQSHGYQMATARF